MGTYQTAMRTQRYLLPHQREGCCNCAHGKSIAENSMLPQTLSRHQPRWECSRGGFMVAAAGICKDYKAKATPLIN